jgi:hypothetical protein
MANKPPVSERDYNNRVIQDSIKNQGRNSLLFTGLPSLKGQKTHPLKADLGDGETKTKNTDEDFLNIIGLPAYCYLGEGGSTPNVFSVIKKKVLQSMTVIEIQPGAPEFGEGGMNLFTVSPSKGEETFKKIMKASGVDKVRSLPLKIAVLSDYSITDSFTHEYADSMFESSANSMGGAAGEITQITGNSSATGAIDQLTKSITGVDLGIGGKTKELANSVLGNLVNKDKAANITKTIDSIAGGSQVDFPMIWKGSSFTPSYSFTCRLVNPYPENEESYQQYIIEPLAHLLAFAANDSASESTFTYPLLCSVTCAGLFKLSAAYISNIEVIKGGESNDISFLQRPGTIDVRMTFASLYTTMVAKEQGSDPTEERPTLKGYLDALRGITVPPIIWVEAGGALADDDTYDTVVDVQPQGKTTPEATTRPEETPEQSAERLSIEQLTNATDPALNTVDELLDAGKTLINEAFKSDVTKEIQQNINNYTEELDQFLAANNGSIPVETQIALRIRNNVPIPPELRNWYVNNYDRFDEVTRSLSGPVEGLLNRSNSSYNQSNRLVESNSL